MRVDGGGEDAGGGDVGVRLSGTTALCERSGDEDVAGRIESEHRRRRTSRKKSSRRTKGETRREERRELQ